MKLIIGLGNPETRYNNTRHNVGFSMIDHFAKTNNVSFKHNVRFKAEIAELGASTDKVLLVKPTTYYNLVGESARSIADFYKVAPEDIVIIHDELALPFGTVRIRASGSDAGNNGVKSLNQHLGQDTMRIRIGVWNELRDHMGDADFVLSKFPADEQKQLTVVADTITSQIEDFIANKLIVQTLHV